MKQSKLFDRTEAVGAMYELKKQGYKDITLEFLDNDELFLACNEGHKEYTIPEIDIDSVDDWTQTKMIKTLRRYDYWWIFD